jgi:hypothetical protein
MDITHNDYQVYYDEASAIITCHGLFRLRDGTEYQPILDLLIEAADTKAETLTLDVRELQFLNSSGINTLSKFILQVRKHKASQVVMQGSYTHPWQKKSLSNFQKLLPTLRLEIE